MAQKMTNYEVLKGTAEEMAYALVNHEYCGSCLHNKDGICAFDQEKEEISTYFACYNAARAWLREEA